MFHFYSLLSLKVKLRFLQYYAADKELLLKEQQEQFSSELINEWNNVPSKTDGL